MKIGKNYMIYYMTGYPRVFQNHTYGAYYIIVSEKAKYKIKIDKFSSIKKCAEGKIIIQFIR